MSPLSEDDKRLSQAMGLEGRFPPFIDLMGITFEPLENDDICIRLKMRNELSLSRERAVLHGGAISAMMDVIGGTVVAWRLKEETRERPLHEQARKLSRLRTVDLRVDYLRPGRGKVFTATGSILRSGSRIAVTRMELRNEEGSLIAVGTGTYAAG